MAEARPLPPQVASRSFAGQCLWVNEKLGELGNALAEGRPTGDTSDKAKQIAEWSETLVEASQRNEPRALMMSGMALRLTGDVGGARGAFERVTEIDPEFVGGWLELAWAHAAQRNHGEALRMLQHALELEPEHTGAMGYLAALHTDLNELDEAHSVITRALEIEPENPLLRELAQTIEKRRSAPWWQRLLGRLLPSS